MSVFGRLASIFREAATIAFGWSIVWPIAKLLPKRNDRIVVIGRDEGKFVDNAKYFYLQATNSETSKIAFIFLTERRDVRDKLRQQSFETVLHPSFASAALLLTTRVVIVDSIEWFMRWRRFLAAGAEIIQLWHGIGYKRIERDKWSHEVESRGWLSGPLIESLRSLRRWLIGRSVRYSVVNTTSAFYRDEVFERAFSSRYFTTFGYARNTFGEVGGAPLRGTDLSVDDTVLRRFSIWRDERRRIVLIAPTFRDSRATPLNLDESIIAALDAYAEDRRVEFIFKFHPLERGAESIRGNHLHLCAPDSDLYPLMPHSDALVTDYSSIYMDYLLLDKPVLFLVPDLDAYVRLDRQLQFDFDAMTPGPKVGSWPELLERLDREWRHDSFSTARAALAQKAFDGQPQELAVPRLLDFMREQGWLAPA